MQTILSFLVALGVLVTIHELGHYWAARYCGVKVLRFSVGMGKPLWRWQKHPDSTEWTISALPLGGYVKMLDERESETPIPAEDLNRAFNRQSVGKRALIVIAGPLANFLLAILLYSVLFTSGVNEPLAILGAPSTQSAAAQAGVQAGDAVVALQNGNERIAIQSWTDLRWQLMRHNVDGQLPALVLKAGQAPERVVQLGGGHDLLVDTEHDGLKQLGLEVQRGPMTVQEIVADSTALRAGLQIGDVLQSVDGVQYKNVQDLIQQLRQRPEQTVTINVLRAGQVVSLNAKLAAVLDTEAKQTVGKLGAGFGQSVEMEKIHYAPIQAAQRGVQKVWEMSEFSLRMMGRMLIGQASLKNISGPMTIADYAGKSAQMGWQSFIGFLALISISLGVLNLLPIPILDGGHLLYYCVEILIGKPIPEIWQARFQKAGMACILMLTSLAIFNDLSRYVGRFFGG